ncbi:uncharacterized protein RHOBADRAFT_55822, partial [Rhodotorula graminis WP1]
RSSTRWPTTSLTRPRRRQCPRRRAVPPPPPPSPEPFPTSPSSTRPLLHTLNLPRHEHVRHEPPRLRPRPRHRLSAARSSTARPSRRARPATAPSRRCTGTRPKWARRALWRPRWDRRAVEAGRRASASSCSRRRRERARAARRLARDDGLPLGLRRASHGTRRRARRSRARSASASTRSRSPSATGTSRSRRPRLARRDHLCA